MKRPLLSIIIPVYNASKSVKKTASDILSQSFKDFELILVDDGSTDKTISVLRGIQSKDKRVVVLSKKNGGPSSARNAGLKRAKGKYIQFFDADDRIPKGALEAVVSSMENTGSDMVVSGWQIDLWVKDELVQGYKTITFQEQEVRGNLEDIKKHVLRSIGTDGRLYNLWNKLFRADIIKDNYLQFNDQIRFGEDVIFALEYFQYVSQINYISDVTYRYQENGPGSVFSKSSLSSEFRIINLAALEGFVGSEPDQEMADLHSWVVTRWLGSYSMMVARSQLPFGQKYKALREVIEESKYVAKNTTFIGIKKYAVQIILRVAMAIPAGMLVAGWVASTLKRALVLVKSSLK